MAVERVAQPASGDFPDSNRLVCACGDKVRSISTDCAVSDISTVFAGDIAGRALGGDIPDDYIAAIITGGKPSTIPVENTRANWPGMACECREQFTSINAPKLYSMIYPT